MTISTTSTHHRTAGDEADDALVTRDNVLKGLWKDWPNEAGFVGLDEHRGPVQLSVKGTIPAFAAGALYRTGPGVNAVENTARGTHNVSHWFDGFAHTHKFDIAPETGAPDSPVSVTYSSRRQADDLVASIRKKGWHAGVSFAQRADPCVGMYAKAKSVFKPSPNNHNVAVHRNLPAGSGPVSGHATSKKTSNIFLTTDNSSMQRLDPDSLEPVAAIRQKRLHKDLAGPLSCAHAQRDEQTGDMFNVNLDLGRTATYRVFRSNATTGSADILATISEPDLSPAYMHSFFLTENYVVVCVPSSHFSWNGAKILWEQNVLEAIKPFDSSRKCQWLVVDRRGTKGLVARFSTPAGFFFHSVNAFEERTHDDDGTERTDICFDYVNFNTTEIMTGFYYDIILNRNNAAKKFWSDADRVDSLNPALVRRRFRLPNGVQKPADAASATAEEVFSIPGPHTGDLPVINPAYACKPYRYVYSTSFRGLSTIWDSLVKTDLHTRDAVMWCGPVGHTPGEPIFVARPGAVDEDDGVVLAVVLDGSAQKSYLLCLDAKTMTELGRAEAEFAIAMGLHGIHAPTAE